MDESIKINVAFLLPEKVEKVVCQLSKKLSTSFETEFTLDNKKFIPHISIYWTEYPYSAAKDIIKIAEKFAKEIPTINFKFENTEIRDDYVKIQLVKTKDIENVHTSFLHQLNKLRKGHIRDKYREQRYLYTLNGDERQMIGMYGYPYSGKMYNPHITLTKFTNKETVSMNPKLLDLGEFNCNEIGIFEMGDHGTCTKLLKKFKLSN